mgnify:CR=1 FL=1
MRTPPVPTAMTVRKVLIALVLVALLGIAGIVGYAAWHYRVPGLALYWLAMQTQDARWKTDGLWLPHYRVTIEGRPIEGIEDDASGLTYSDHTGTLFAIINKSPHTIVELDTEGRVLRKIRLHGLRDPEGITHVRDNVFAVADERDQAVYRIEIHPDTTQIHVRDVPRITFPLGGRDNRGYEGLSWDSAGERLFVSQEKDPLRVLVISGLPDLLDGTDFDLRIEEWTPDHALHRRLIDLSSLTLHEPTGNLLLLSDESAVVVEYTPDGEAVSLLPLWPGFHGLTRRVPQAEGMAVGPDGTLYIVSEPNLFYRFERTVPATWAR